MEISSKSQAENGTDNNTIMTPLRVKQSIAANAGGGAASDYSSLVNKPQINSITLDGNKTGAQLGLASSSDIPTKTSDLQNDTGYITGMTILTYGSSTWQNFLDAYNANRVVYCKASSGSNPGSGSKTRRAFLAYVNNETNPTEVEFQYYRSVATHSATQQGDQVFVYKLNSSGTWSVTTREASSKVVAGTGLSSTYSSGTLTLSTASNNAVTDANNNFSATQRINGTVYSQSSYIEKGGGLGLRATGPVPGPVTNETGAITFYQWMEDAPDVYTEITKAKISVANVLDQTNANPYYIAYDENGNTVANSQLALMSDIPTSTSDLYNDSGYLSSIPTMYGFLSNSVSITSGTYTEINTLSSYFNNTNGKLSISNGKIKVGSGVSLIKVSL